MKRSICHKKLACLLAAVMTISGIVNIGVVSKVKAAETTMAVKNINMKQQDNFMPGIAKPTSTGSDAAAWEGDYVYFGKFGGEPVKFRVLNPTETNYGGNTMLLDSDSVLKQMQYSTGYDVGWGWSPLKTWMNGSTSGQFLEGFTAAETNSIAASTKATQVGAGEFPSDSYTYVALSGEKVFALDASEANYSGYGYANDATRVKQGGIGEWWLRSKNPKVNDGIATVYNDGNIYNYYFPNYEKVGASPALNVDLDKVLFTSPAEQAKATSFTKTEASSANEWKLTLKAADTNINASTSSTTTFYADQAENDDRTISISHVEANTVLPDANQVSAMLTDSTGSVLYYGKIGESTATSSSVMLADDLEAGEYKLYVFAEETNGNKKSDYASDLGTPIAITVKSTSEAGTYQVTVTDGMGSGTYEAGKTVEIRANLAPDGKQFKKWEVTAGNIVLADETSAAATFVMPESEVAVTAVYEDITETSDTGDYTNFTYVVLFVTVAALAVLLFIYRKKLIRQ